MHIVSTNQIANILHYNDKLHKHIFVFHKSDLVKCKLLTNFEEKFIARKNRMNSKTVISEAAVRRCSSK